MQSGNPTLSEKAFLNVASHTHQQVMTSKGAYSKTALLLGICVASATFTMNAQSGNFIAIGSIAGLVMALITIFKKQWAPITAPIYAVFEGLALGGVSFIYQSQYPGIVSNAIMLTFAVMALMLYVYASGIIQVTDKLKKGIVIATGAIALVYLVSIAMSFFGASIPMIHSSGPIGIGFSLLVVGVATFNLLIDFDFIEKAASSKTAPKYMEWYAGFSLMVTLVWLYLEILRLLAKLNGRK